MEVFIKYVCDCEQLLRNMLICIICYYENGVMGYVCGMMGHTHGVMGCACGGVMSYVHVVMGYGHGVMIYLIVWNLLIQSCVW